jgi:hypothetical protein
MKEESEVEGSRRKRVMCKQESEVGGRGRSGRKKVKMTEESGIRRKRAKRKDLTLYIFLLPLRKIDQQKSAFLIIHSIDFIANFILCFISPI